MLLSPSPEKFNTFNTFNTFNLVASSYGTQPSAGGEATRQRASIGQ
jgi:hypothetical protein